VPSNDTLGSDMFSLFHDNPESSHFGALRTAELISRDFHWPGIDATAQKYIAGCVVYHRIKAPRHARHGGNMPMLPTYRPWEGVRMDFVSDLSESTASGFARILVVIDLLTNIPIYLPYKKDIDSPDLSRMFFQHVTCKQSELDNIITDRGTQFNSRFCTRVCTCMSIDHRLSTAFHPQTDSKMERQNQTMEQYLRAFCNKEQYNWIELVPLAEFAYNNSMNASTKMTPFWAVYHCHSEMQFKEPKGPANFKSEIQADAVLGGLEETHRLLRQSILDEQEPQTKYAGGKEFTFKVGNIVWLSTKHFRTLWPSKNLDY
jgi:hypothetical protein